MITFTTMGEQDTGVVGDTDQAAGQCDTFGWAHRPAGDQPFMRRESLSWSLKPGSNSRTDLGMPL
jgi:hypothetical protein